MSDSKDLPNYLKFLFASTAGIGSALVVFPLDLLKTRMQVMGKGSKAARITSIQLAKTIIKNEGLFAMYNGLSASCLRQATYTGVRMGAYQSLLDYFTENGKPPNFAIKSFCGIISGILGGIAGLPADVALVRMAADGLAPPEQRRNYTNVFNALVRIFQEEGPLALLRGINPQIVRAVTVNLSQLVSYSQAKEFLLKYEITNDNTICHLTCSLFSAFVATTCVLPPDIAKTRIQNMVVENGKAEYTGMIDVWIKIVTKEGVSALWKGFTPLFVRNGPQFVVVFLLYENLIWSYRKLVAEKGT